MRRRCARRRESGARAGYDGGKKIKGTKVHIAVDTLGNLLTLLVTPANEQERDQVSTLCEDIQAVTGATVAKVFADGGYTGEAAAQAAKAHGIRSGDRQGVRYCAWLRRSAQAMDCRTLLRMEDKISPTRQRLRTATRGPSRGYTSPSSLFSCSQGWSLQRTQVRNRPLTDSPATCLTGGLRGANILYQMAHFYKFGSNGLTILVVPNPTTKVSHIDAKSYS